MTIAGCWARMRLRVSPVLLQVAFVAINVAIVAGQFHQMLPSSERWG